MAKGCAMPTKGSESIDIYNLLSEQTEEASVKTHAKTVRQELLDETKYKDKDLFPNGTISVNKHTCVGLQCKLCIKACPTNALYWTNSGIAITEELCLHCEACVLCCMVDDCIRITRKREDGKTERFSRIRDISVLNNKLNAKKRCQRILEIFPSTEAYIERYTRTK